MTSRSDDELVSSVLDGEASADERAAVASDPVLRDRLAAFASVQRAVQGVELDDGLADRIRLAALAAFDADHADTAAPEGDAAAPVTPMAAHRARAQARRRTSGALAAAAAVVIGLLGFAALRPTDEDASLTTAGSTATAGSAAPEVLRAAPAAGDTAATSPSVRDVGAAPDVAALAAAWRAVAAKAAPAGTTGLSGPTTPTGAAGAASAAAAVPSSARCGPAVGYGTLAGRPVVLVADANVIRVLDAARCIEVATFEP
jgi:hypothetical protein